VITKVIFREQPKINFVNYTGEWTILFLKYQVQLTKLISEFRMPIYVH